MTQPVPDDWYPGTCDSCKWFLEQYDREDLYLFPNPYRGRYCVFNKGTAKTKAEKGKP